MASPQPKIDALIQYKEEILEGHRSGLSVHRIAQIFRERGVLTFPFRIWCGPSGVLSTKRSGPVRLRLLIKVRRVLQQRNAISTRLPLKKRSQRPRSYQVSEQPSSRVQEEEFAKQLRLARYLAAASLPPRALEPVRQPRTPKRAHPIAKAGAKTKAGTVSKKAQKEE